MSCSSLWVIYIIFCNNCTDFYIGSTNNFRNRMNLHRFHTTHDESNRLYVNKHFSECCGNNDKGFKAFPFHKVNKEDPTYLLCKEMYFIRMYRPPLNR